MNTSIKDIINMGKGHSDWQTLKESNPEEYLRLSRDAIMKKFELVVPQFIKWQQRYGEFKDYENSLPPLDEVLKKLDFTLYDNGLEGKKELTRIFFHECIPYGVNNIISHLSKIEIELLYKIRNLINRSFTIFYTNRKEIIKKISKVLEINDVEIEEISLLRYIPFLNIKIGIEWISRRTNPTFSELLNDWLILLCFDNKQFISDEFISELTIFYGEDYLKRLLQKLFIHIARLNKPHSIYAYVIKKYSKKINKYRKYLQNGEIVEDITFAELKFTRYNIKFYKCICPLQAPLNESEIKYLKTTIDCQRPLTILINKVPQNGYFHFRPISANDMEYLMKSIKKSRIEVSTLNPNYTEKIDSKSSSTGLTSILGKIIASPYSEDLYIAKNINASEFIINESYIEFRYSGKNYFFKSSKIQSNVSQSILEKITHKFTLVKDRPITVGENTEFRFYFEPANDFSFLLAEIDRLTDPIYIDSNSNFPQEGEFEIPWKYVRFHEGILSIIHPNPSKRGTLTPFYFRHSDILKSFEDIRPYIETKCCKFIVSSVDGVITSLLNFKEFMKYIDQYKDWEENENIGFSEPLNRIKNVNINPQVFSRNSEVKKSPYLKYLASIHLQSYNIIYLLERVIHESGLVDTDEYGYLFVLKRDLAEMILLYENIFDSSRSSIIFYVDPNMYTEAVNAIKRFLACDIRNKRQKLSNGKINFNAPYIYKYRRLMHTNITDWKCNLKIHI